MAGDPQVLFSSEIVKRYVSITSEADFDFKRQLIITHGIVTGLVVKAGLDDYSTGSVAGALHSTYAFIGLVKPQLASLKNTKKELELRILLDFDTKIEKFISELANCQSYQTNVRAVMVCQKALRFIEKKFALFGFIIDQLEEGDL